MGRVMAHTITVLRQKKTRGSKKKKGRAFELNKNKTLLKCSCRTFSFLMDKYLVNLQPTTKNPNSIRRCRWKRSVVELNGRFEPNYRHDLSTLLMQSYYEVGIFSHLYSLNGLPCQTHINRIADTVLHTDVRIPIKKQGLSALEFDSKGVYLASVTKSGCLTVHDFEVLYCQSQTKDSSPCLQEDENKILVHLSMPLELDSVRWNPSNQDEVVCTSMKSDEVLIFDIGYVSSEPTKVLKTRRTATAYGSYICKGLSDIAFTKTDDSRLIASDTNGVLHVWDKRMSSLPCLEFTTNSYGTINSIQLNVDNQVFFGAGKQGIIYSWDLRGGKASAMFQTQNVVRYPPLTSLKLSSMLERIRPLKAQSNIVSKEIHSINLDPSCPHQLAFHLDDGWSGVLDLHNLEVTHIHCPPPAWLNGSSVWDDQLHLRKPTWLPTYSIYAVGSSSENGIHLLDFYPHASSPSHVYNEDIDSLSRDKRRKQHQFIPTSEPITACIAHPLNGAIVAGTKQSSLLMVSQRGRSFEG